MKEFWNVTIRMKSGRTLHYMPLETVEEITRGFLNLKNLPTVAAVLVYKANPNNWVLSYNY